MRKQELNYYDEFIKNIECAVEIATILREYTCNFDYNKSEEIEQKVHNLEIRADRNLHNILDYLIKDFMPPIDRENIIMLVHRIDDIVDKMDEVVINLNILAVQNLRDDFGEFTDHIYKCCLNLKELMLKLKACKKYEEINPIVATINSLEEYGDSIYQKSIRNLFKHEDNPIEVIKWKTIYNGLEDCFDAAENIALSVQEIVMKNA